MIMDRAPFSRKNRGLDWSVILFPAREVITVVITPRISCSPKKMSISPPSPLTVLVDADGNLLSGYRGALPESLIQEAIDLLLTE